MVLEPNLPVERLGDGIGALDLQVQGANAERAALLRRELDRPRAHAQVPVAGRDEQLVDEGVAPAVLQAVR